MITQTQSNSQGPSASGINGAMDAAVSNSNSSNSNGFGGGGSDDMQNKPLPSFQK